MEKDTKASDVEPPSGETGNKVYDPKRINIDHSSAAVYLLRTAQQHHVHLSSMADNKANIMIGVSALIFSMLIGYIQKEGLGLPTGILAVSTLMAATTAIMAVLPSSKGQAPGNPGFNPLFFGCFSQLTPEEFCREMEKVLRDDPSVYTALAMDMYGIGHVLYRKKYRYLAFSYRIFLGGLFLAFLAGLFTNWK